MHICWFLKRGEGTRDRLDPDVLRRFTKTGFARLPGSLGQQPIEIYLRNTDFIENPPIPKRTRARTTNAAIRIKYRYNATKTGTSSRRAEQ